MAEKQFTTTLKYVEKIVESLKNKENKNRISHLVESIRNADGLKIYEDDEERRVLYLNLNAIALAQQATWMAFSEDVLTNELEKEFRALPSAEEAQKLAKEAEDKVTEEEKELSKKLNDFRERAKQYDIMRSVCNGRSADEAKKMQDEYEKQAAQMRG